MATPEQEAAAEEAARLTAEIESYYRQRAAALHRQELLNEELDYCIEQLGILEANARSMAGAVNKDVDALNDHLKREALDARDLLQLLRDVSERYFTYKNLSTATKNLTQYNDEYYTKYRFFHELRRISLGSVMAVDTNIISQESARSAVEKTYLANTDYWLAYATMAIMLWWSDEREASERAMRRALMLGERRASLMFLFCNLRFDRKQTAAAWYEYYLDRIHSNDVGGEFQYLLEANLAGAFGNAHTLSSRVNARIQTMVTEIGVTEPDFQARVANKASASIGTLPHVSDFNFTYLPDYCAQISEQRALLDDAEKIALAARNLQEASQAPDRTDGIIDRLEDSIYHVIDSMEPQEEKLYRSIRYNEMVVAAKGDVTVARRAFDERYPEESRVSFADLLLTWAFSDGDTTILPQTRRFAIEQVADGMRRGYDNYVQSLHGREHERYTITVDDWSRDCTEFEIDSAKNSYNEHFDKNRMRYMLSDKLAIVFILVMVAAVVGLVTCAFAWLHWVPIVVCAVLLLAGGLALWLRIQNLGEILEQRRRKSLEIIDRTLRELGQWRTALKEALAQETVLTQAFDLFA